MIDAGLFTSVVDRLVEPVIAAMICAWAVLALGRVIRFARANPWPALAAALIVGLGLAARYLSAPRLPMVGAQADFDRLRLAAACLWGPGCWNALRTDYPPGTSVLLSLFFRVTGPSIDVAFTFTTLLGALTALPAFGAAWRVAGAWGAVFAGLALAVLPSSVVFSNGLNYEVPAGFFLTATLAHALAWQDEQRPVDALLVGLALALFLLMRPESVLQAPAIALALIAATLAAGRWRLLASRRGLPAWAGLVLPPLLASAVRVRGMLAGHSVPHPGPVELALAAVVVAVVVSALVALGPPLVRRLAERPLGRRWMLALAVVVLYAAWRYVREVAGVSAFLPRFSDTVPVTLEAMARSFGPSYGPPAPSNLLTPWFFPIVFFVPLAVAWWPRRDGRSPASDVGVFLASALVLAFTAIARRLPLSGEMIGDGVRYLVPVTGALAIAVGVGAARLIEAVPAIPRARGAVAVLLGVAFVSPLATHVGITGDVDFDQQRQYLFLRAQLAELPARADVLFPDHDVYAEGQPERGWPVNLATHTGPLISTLGLPERNLVPVGFRDWLRPTYREPAPTFVLLGLDCYRTRTGGEDPTCYALRSSPSLKRLASDVFVDRPYDRYPLTFVPEIEIAFYQVRPGAEAELRRELQGTIALPAPPPPVR